jgi:hypothetical protein
MQRRLSTTQPASQRVGILGPATSPKNTIIAGSAPARSKSAALPVQVLRSVHDLAHAGSHRVGIDRIRDRGPSVSVIGAREGARGPFGPRQPGPDCRLSHGSGRG